MWRKYCGICENAYPIEVLDLGMHPCADLFINQSDIHEGISDKIWPLIVCECKFCGHIQTKYEVSQDVRYKDYEYSFISSHSKSYCDYWDNFAKKAVTPGDNVLELGCNDGYLLSVCKNMGCKTLGVDPSPNMAKIAQDRGLEVICDYFESANIETEKFNVIIANNVLNHIDDLKKCMRLVHKSLVGCGKFVIQVPDWTWMVESNLFDQIYHEHVHYFTEKSIRNLAEVHGFFVSNIEQVEFHGKSLLVTLIKDSIGQNSITNYSGQLDYDFLSKHIKNVRIKTLEKINETLSQNREIIALGASAKGNTFLNYVGLSSKDISGILEVSDLKIGKCTAMSRIEIFEEDKIRELHNPLVLLTTWNLPKIVQHKLLEKNSTIEFYNPQEKNAT